MIPSEPLELVDQVARDYLTANAEVATMAQQDGTVAAAWHLTVELAAAADGVLRAWRTPHAQRRQMVAHLLEQAFGTPAGRLGAEMARQLAEAVKRDVASERFVRELTRIMVAESPTEVDLHGVKFRYVDNQWVIVDTPVDAG